MQLREIYGSTSPTLSVEIFPPRTPAGERALAGRIPAIAALRPAFVSVTCTNLRDKTVEWSRRVRHEFGLEVMTHLTCIGYSAEQVSAQLDELRALGIGNIIALRGDPPQGVAEWHPHPQGFRYAVEMVRLARAKGGFGVAVAGFPETHPQAESPEADIDRLREKVDAGADVVMTQLFLDNDSYYRFVDRARAAGVTVPIVPGILPFRTVPQLRRFTTELARTFHGPTRIPPALAARLVAVEQDDDAAYELGLDWATAQCEDLLRHGAPGIHFYCLNESRAVEAIMHRLGYPRP